MLRIRTMTESDIPFGLELCRLAGWNQVEADWRRLLTLEPEGVFVAESTGHPCGTASITVYGRRVAWIGMVLVHPDFRRQGTGTALLRHAVSVLEERRIESIKLDATDQGRPVYLKLGFRDERPVHRYAGPVAHAAAADASVADLAEGDWAAVGAMDAAAFGADRVVLLRQLAADGRAVVARRGGAVRGYGFLRAGHEADFLGPMVAVDAEAAGAMVGALLADRHRERVYLDVLPGNRAAVELAESLGMAVARRLTRMVLGERMNTGDVARVYATAGLELG